MGVVISGMKELTVHLDKKAKPEELLKQMTQACLIVEAAARQKCPVDTGRLRGSIASRSFVQDGNIVGEVYTPTEYGIYVEYGTGLYAEGGVGRQTPWRYQDDEGNWHTTSGQKPQPFMRTALAENEEAVKRVLGNA